jgi:hypothetical protein
MTCSKHDYAPWTVPFCISSLDYNRCRKISGTMKLSRRIIWYASIQMYFALIYEFHDVTVPNLHIRCTMTHTAFGSLVFRWLTGADEASKMQSSRERVLGSRKFADIGPGTGYVASPFGNERIVGNSTRDDTLHVIFDGKDRARYRLCFHCSRIW